MMECADIINLDYVNKLTINNNVTLLLHPANIAYITILTISAIINKMPSNAMFMNVNFFLSIRYKL